MFIEDLLLHWSGLDLKQPENLLEENKYILLKICEIAITVNTNQGATMLILVDSVKWLRQIVCKGVGGWRAGGKN